MLDYFRFDTCYIKFISSYLSGLDFPTYSCFDNLDFFKVRMCRAGPHSAVGSPSDSKARSPGFDTRSGHILSFLLPLICRRAIVSYWRKYVHEALVNR